MLEVKLMKEKEELAKKKSTVLECNPSQVFGMLHNSFCKYGALSGTRDFSNLRLYLSTLERANFTYKVSQLIYGERSSLHNLPKRNSF